jgi:hypothetical protein
VCEKGNACLTCDLFVTDRSHLDALRRQQDATASLIDQRRAEFASRFGEPMGDDHVWLEPRLREARAFLGFMETDRMLSRVDAGQEGGVARRAVHDGVRNEASSMSLLPGGVASGLEQGGQLFEQMAHAPILGLQPLKLLEQSHRCLTIEAAWLLGRQKRYRPANPFQILVLEETGGPGDAEAI